jgi:hypothetical protein
LSKGSDVGAQEQVQPRIDADGGQAPSADKRTNAPRRHLEHLSRLPNVNEPLLVHGD